VYLWFRHFRILSAVKKPIQEAGKKKAPAVGAGEGEWALLNVCNKLRQVGRAARSAKKAHPESSSGASA
jgi:hypothetical protein